ncbi:MAG: hypothetical protein ACFFB3_23115 [Candidatus Hodarchaeota archaeon]
MIEAIVVINNAGLPVFHCKSSNVSWNEEMFSAFLSAMESFIEWAWKDERLFYIKLGEKQIFLSRDKKASLGYTLVASSSVPDEIADRCLVEFRLAFEKFFPKIIEFNGIVDEGIPASFLRSTQRFMEHWNLKLLQNTPTLKKNDPNSFYEYEGLQKSEINLCMK